MGLKINLHITQKCNFNCKYCFAHFEDKQDLSLEAWKRIIDNIACSGEIDAINFAGGEPVLYRGFHELLAYAYEKGFRLSVISNGSLMLRPELMAPEDFAMLETLGISVDSIDRETLIALGACTCSHKILSYEDLRRIVRLARTENPTIRIKLNTVVTNVNAKEDLTAIGRELAVDRWKFLRMKQFSHEGFNNAHLLASDQEFDGFVARNAEVSQDVIPENDLTRSYIMVDNQGRLLDDKEEDYQVVGNLLEEDFSSVFRRYQFDRAMYESRYAS